MTSYPNVRHLRVLSAVARTGRVSAAAEQVHLSQPAVTNALAKLERDLGAVFFDRLSTGMVPTKVGDAFLARVDRTLVLLRGGTREAKRIGLRRTALATPDFDHLVTNVQLQALLAVAEAGNFSLAARTLGVSQPSLHRAARDLEKLAGVALFLASPQGVRLTSAAETLVQRTRLAFAELRQGLDEIDAFLGQDSTRIRVGALPLSRTRILPEAISRMVALRQGVQIQSVDGPYAELLFRLRHGDLDCLIGALRLPPPVDDIVQEPLFLDPLALIVGQAHPLAKKRRVSLDDTLTYPWVAPPKNTPAGTYLFETLRLEELPQTPVRVVSSSLVLLRALLSLGPFVTIISPHQARQEIDNGTFVQLPIDLSDSARPIGLTFRVGWRPTATQNQFINLLREAAGGPAK